MPEFKNVTMDTLNRIRNGLYDCLNNYAPETMTDDEFEEMYVALRDEVIEIIESL